MGMGLKRQNGKWSERGRYKWTDVDRKGVIKEDRIVTQLKVIQWEMGWRK
jgi:hypothetical protein